VNTGIPDHYRPPPASREARMDAKVRDALDYFAQGPHMLDAEFAATLRAHIEGLEAWRDAVLDGNAVYAALTPDDKRRTSATNVNDVLDAAAKVARALLAPEDRQG
jgi:hypothetical protein